MNQIGPPDLQPFPKLPPESAAVLRIKSQKLIKIMSELIAARFIREKNSHTDFNSPLETNRGNITGRRSSKMSSRNAANEQNTNPNTEVPEDFFTWPGSDNEPKNDLKKESQKPSNEGFFDPEKQECSQKMRESNRIGAPFFTPQNYSPPATQRKVSQSLRNHSNMSIPVHSLLSLESHRNIYRGAPVNVTPCSAMTPSNPSKENNKEQNHLERNSIFEKLVSIERSERPSEQNQNSISSSNVTQKITYNGNLKSICTETRGSPIITTRVIGAFECKLEPVHIFIEEPEIKQRIVDKMFQVKRETPVVREILVPKSFQNQTLNDSPVVMQALQNYNTPLPNNLFNTGKKDVSVLLNDTSSKKNPLNILNNELNNRLDHNFSKENSIIYSQNHNRLNKSMPNKRQEQRNIGIFSDGKGFSVQSFDTRDTY